MAEGVAARASARERAREGARSGRAGMPARMDAGARTHTRTKAGALESARAQRPARARARRRTHKALAACARAFAGCASRAVLGVWAVRRSADLLLDVIGDLPHELPAGAQACAEGKDISLKGGPAEAMRAFV